MPDVEMLHAYVSPKDQSSLDLLPEGLQSGEQIFRFLPGSDLKIPDFRDISTLRADSRASLEMYDFEGARTIYRNFLSWMFRTFDADEGEFRNDLLNRLQLRPNSRVLVTGCGIGDDVFALADLLGPEGMIFASDLAPEMILATHAGLAERSSESKANVSLSVCDACSLPFSGGYFDAAFHFGGINLFDDVGLAINEMARVTRDGGRIVFGDEGVAPWLANTEYGRMVVANNHLWSAKAPIDLLPFSAVNPKLSWVLGNCFYVIEFEKDTNGPSINPDIQHVGRRGGSMRSRYFGQLEGVDPGLKDQVLRAAADKKMSVADWLAQAVGDALKSSKP
ncbi:methyltransferase domain-containing protein [Paraburkholderia tropica]|nr:methyltransferase domain-containing protein [Paraburkholderia tropica]